METLMLRAFPKCLGLVHQCWHFLSYWAAEFMVALETNIYYVFAFPDHLPSDNDVPFITKTASPSSPSPRPYALAAQFGHQMQQFPETDNHFSPASRWFSEWKWLGIKHIYLKILDFHFEYYWGWLIFPFPNINPRVAWLILLPEGNQPEEGLYKSSLILVKFYKSDLGYPPLSPGVCSNSCPLSQWYCLTISSPATVFSFYLHSFPTLVSFPMSQVFTLGGQSSGALASVSVHLQWIFRVDFL